MSDDPFVNLFVKFLRDKKTAVRSVSEDVNRIHSLDKGLAVFLENIDIVKLDEDDIRQKLKILMRVLKTQSTIISKMMILMLAYIQSSNFDQDVANMLDKLGKGEEALEAMMDKQLKGDND